jgi:hypothetical protein
MFDKSSWWFYFEKIGHTNVAKCKICGWSKDIGAKKCTNTLQHHLKTKHDQDQMYSRRYLRLSCTIIKI